MLCRVVSIWFCICFRCAFERYYLHIIIYRLSICLGKISLSKHLPISILCVYLQKKYK